MIGDLRFLAMIDCEKTPEDVRSILSMGLRGARKDTPGVLRIAGNWVSVLENDDFDPTLAKDEEDGFLYYRYRIEVAPDSSVTLSEQVELAKAFQVLFERMNCRCTICADFEDSLTSP